MATKNVERVLSAISNDADSFDIFVHDWASWDDTYNFVQNSNYDYIQTNLMDETFINSKLNLMLFINISGQPVFGKAFDLHIMTEVPVPDGILEKISLNGIFLCTFNETKVIKGLILIPEGPMLIVSRPILTSYDEGPAKGTLIMGRYYDSAQVACIA